jgi:arsenate reductase (thioredoxin)
VAAAVGVYIAAAIMFTASDAFANPAVTIARMLTDTWTGIHPASAPAFLAGQAVGTAAAIALTGWLYAPKPHEAAQIIVPTHNGREPTDPTGAVAMTDDHTPTVLFLCVQNAGRSQMAAAWMHHLAGEHVRVLSGGSNPADDIHHVAIEAMHEVGIDLTRNQPRPWTREDLEHADVVVTMGCGDECPVVPGTRYLDWELPDPSGKPLEEVRPIRDDIRTRVEELLDELQVTTG